GLWRTCIGRKCGRFVHVVPESTDAIGNVAFEERAEPCTRTRIGEIGKGARAGPHVRMKLRTVRRFTEKILRASLLVSEIAFVQLDARINDDDNAETFGAQVA